MLQQFSAILHEALGLDLESKDIGVAQMCLRAAIVFIISIGLLRIGSRRFVGRSTPVDIMLVIVFGSVVSRAITGTSPFFPTLAAALTLIIMHWIVSAITVRSHAFGKVVKGGESKLVEDGEIDWRAMRAGHISEHDLQEAIRAHGAEPDVSQVRSAYLERNGDISVVFKNTAGDRPG